VDFHRTHDSIATILLRSAPVEEEDKEQEALSKQILREYGLVDYIGLGNQNRLLYMCAAADLESNMKISKPLLQRYPNLTIHTNLLDAHFYIFAKEVMTIFLAQATEKMKSIKGELLPFFNQMPIRS